MRNCAELGILFDLDGTLVDSVADIAAVANHVRELYRLAPLPKETIRSLIGRGVDHFVKSAFPEVPAAEFPKLLQVYGQYYLENPCSAGTLYPGVRETLETLRRNPKVALGVITNKPSLVADKTLAHYLPGIAFEEIAGPERVSEKKPSPRHILDVLDRLGLEPSAAWYVGDDPIDAECAESARVRFLGAGYGSGGVRVEAKRMLAHFPELLTKISRNGALTPPIILI